MDMGYPLRPYQPRPHGIGVPFIVSVVIHDPCGAAALLSSRLLLTDKSNVTAITDRLEAAGFVRRRTAPQDRRVSLLSVTPAGGELHDLVFAAHQDRLRALVDGDEATLRQLRLPRINPGGADRLPRNGFRLWGANASPFGAEAPGPSQAARPPAELVHGLLRWHPTCS